MQVNLTKDEMFSLQTTLFVAHENALNELRISRGREAQGVTEYLQIRATALDKLREAIQEEYHNNGLRK